jgi:OOP family OmpA-OmpF porin
MRVTTTPLLIVLLLPAAVGAQTVTNDGYARDPSDQVVMNPFGLCWRTSQWTEAKAIAQCDPDLVKPAPKPAALATPPAAPAPALAPAAPPPPPVAAAPAPAPAPAPFVAPVVAQPETRSMTLGADASFDSGKADLKPQGRAELDGLAAKLSAVKLDSMTIVGHTDNTGKADYNQKLSERRAEAVKTYLVGKGVDGSKIRTSGRGMAEPVADNKTSQGRARNRRVDVQVTGTRM